MERGVGMGKGEVGSGGKVSIEVGGGGKNGYRWKEEWGEGKGISWKREWKGGIGLDERLNREGRRVRVRRKSGNGGKDNGRRGSREEVKMERRVEKRLGREARIVMGEGK